MVTTGSELRKIEKDVREIRDQQSSIWGSFKFGVFYGAGWIVGTVLAVILASYLLSVFNVIPGFEIIGKYLYTGLESAHAPKI